MKRVSGVLVGSCRPWFRLLLTTALLGLACGCSAEPVEDPVVQAPTPDLADSPSGDVQKPVEFVLPLATEKGYSVTVSASGGWTPNVVLGDPGKIRLAAGGAVDTSTSTITGEVTNTTEGGRPVTLNYGGDGWWYMDLYWHAPTALTRSACTECSPSNSYLRGAVVFNQTQAEMNGHSWYVLDGDATAPLTFGPAWGELIDRVNADPIHADDGQFPESEQGALEEVLGQPADYVVIHIGTRWLEDGITQGGSCIVRKQSGTFVEAVYENSTGEMLSESAARKTGLSCSKA